MIGPKNLFWDSCVFIRYLTRIPPVGIADIEEFILDANAKLLANRRKIYYSTIVMAEIRPRFFARKSLGSIDDLFLELGSAFEPIDPNPNILKAVGELRDATPIDPSTKKPSTVRTIGTPDAIHLMTCLYARDVLGIHDIVFHTFDTGKGKNWEGRCVPLLGFKDWFPEGSRNARVEEVCSLEISLPQHPAPPLPNMVIPDDAPKPNPSH